MKSSSKTVFSVRDLKPGDIVVGTVYHNGNHFMCVVLSIDPANYLAQVFYEHNIQTLDYKQGKYPFVWIGPIQSFGLKNVEKL